MQLPAFPFDRSWPLEEALPMACILEATAPKLGNVHPEKSFQDMHWGHFLASGLLLSRAASHEAEGVGGWLLEQVKANSHNVGRNTNLGTLILFAPIAVAYQQHDVATSALASRQPFVHQFRQAIQATLNGLSSSDAALVYEAIRLASPGGMGQQPQHDVHGPPPQELIEAMRRVADFDAVARQYVNGFADIFDRMLDWLDQALLTFKDPLQAICFLQLQQMAHEPDGLIIRKAGKAVADGLQRQAAAVLHVISGYITEAALRDSDGTVISVSQQAEYRQFDHHLRTQQNRLNPGTTADLIATTLALRLLFQSPG